MQSSPEEPTGPQPRWSLRFSIIVVVLVTAGLVAGIVVAGGHGTTSRNPRRSQPAVAISSPQPAPTTDGIPMPSLPEPTTGEPPSPEPDSTEAPSQEPVATDETVVPTVPQCVDSFDPQCGEFRWEPSPPANQPIHIDAVVVDPPNPIAGQPFTVTIQWSDADADVPAPAYHYVCDTQCVMGDPLPLACDPPFPTPAGAWTLPAPRPGAGTLVESLYFPVAGTFTWEIGIATASSAIQDRARDSGACAGLVDPYSSWTVVSDSITIGAGLVVPG